MLADIRLAWRQLLKTPGFTAIALLTLGLGIGVNTTMFTVTHTLLFQQLGFSEPDRLVRIFRTAPQSQRWPHSPANFLDIRNQARSFSAMAAYQPANCSYAEPGQPAERLRGIDATGDFFPLLGISAQLGRTFTAEDARPGAEPVVVLSHTAWVRRFGADPSVIGRQIRLDGTLTTIIGVMPAAFTSPLFWGQIELWRPHVLTARDEQVRESNYLAIVGRLAPGATMEQANAELQGIAARLERDYPQTNAGYGLRPMLFADSHQNESTRQMTGLAMGLAGFVLLIACANLANLQFARTAGRAREYAIRVALGAPRWRIVRELLTESLLISLLGAALGLLLALWSNDLLGRQIAALDAPGLVLHLEWPVFAFALAAAALSALALGLLPALSAARADVNDTLNQQSRGSTADRSHHRVRHALIVAEVALALILLAGAGVFIRGLQRFTERDVGWKTEGLVVGYLNLPPARYGDQEARNTFFNRLNTALIDDPAFTHAALASSLPTFGYVSSTSLVPEGRPLPPLGQEPVMHLVYVTPSYFDTLGMRLLAGRNFTDDDRTDTTEVAIINEAMARALWPGEDPIGRRIGDAEPGSDYWRVVVGVVSDVSAPGSLNPPDSRFHLYRPIQQESFPFFSVAVRGHGTADELGRALRRVVSAIDPDLPVHGINQVDAEVARALGSFNLIGSMVGGFAMLGLALSALGIYGVLAGFVAQRRAEIGVRMALGAQTSDVLGLVLGRGLWLSVLGAGIGLFGSYALIRVLGRILPELGSPDLLTIAGVLVVLLAVAFLACWLPARRATRVDPMTALRSE